MSERSLKKKSGCSVPITAADIVGAKPKRQRTPKPVETVSDAELERLRAELAEAEAEAEAMLKDLQAAQPNERFNVTRNRGGLTYKVGNKIASEEEFAAAGGVVGVPPIRPTPPTEVGPSEPRGELRVFVTNWPASLTQEGALGTRMAGPEFEKMFNVAVEDGIDSALQRLGERGVAGPPSMTGAKGEVEEKEPPLGAAPITSVAVARKAALREGVPAEVIAAAERAAEQQAVEGATRRRITAAEEASRSALQESPVRALSVSVGQAVANRLVRAGILTRRTMLNERLARVVPAGNDVDHTIRDARLLNKLRKHEGGQRRARGGLEHDAFRGARIDAHERPHVGAVGHEQEIAGPFPGRDCFAHLAHLRRAILRAPIQIVERGQRADFADLH